jgi:hypothetical protein
LQCKKQKEKRSHLDPHGKVFKKIIGKKELLLMLLPCVDAMLASLVGALRESLGGLDEVNIDLTSAPLGHMAAAHRPTVGKLAASLTPIPPHPPVFLRSPWRIPLQV